jgi:uncharacterized protein (DUF2267 family)
VSAVKQAVFRNAFSKANDWINEVARRMKCNDKILALKALRAVLHALRDRLTIEEAVQLSAQLPLVIRGVYFEGWSPFDAAERGGGLAGFFAEIESHLPDMTDRERKRTVQVVFDVLAHHISSGEVDDIAAVLPAELREFWATTVAN